MEKLSLSQYTDVLWIHQLENRTAENYLPVSKPSNVLGQPQTWVFSKINAAGAKQSDFFLNKLLSQLSLTQWVGSSCGLHETQLLCLP